MSQREESFEERLRVQRQAVTRAITAISDSISVLPVDLRRVLQVITDQARLVANARYAALGIEVDPNRSFEPWVFSGVPPEQAAAIGHYPRPVGLLGAVPHGDRTIRLREMERDPRFRGFPPHHPEMHAFLGVPIRYRGRSVGNLYLAEKAGAEEFGEEDQWAVELLAAHAGVALQVAGIDELRANVEAERGRLQAVLESAPNGVVYFDSVSRRLVANQAAVSLLGYTPDPGAGIEQFVGRVLRPDGQLAALEQLPSKRALGGETVRAEEYLLARPDGSHVPVMVGAAPIGDPKGGVIGAVLVLVDITEQKAAAAERERLLEEVQRRSAELDAAILSSVDGMVIFNQAGQVVLMNPAADRMLGYSGAEPKPPLAERMDRLSIETPEGKPFPPEELPVRKALLGECCPSIVAVLRPPRGEALWATLSSAPIRSPGGKLMGAVLTFTDITPIQKLQQQRAKHVLGISHGLRTPLTVVQGQAQLLLRELDRAGVDGQMHHSTEAIAASSQRMSLLLRDLVDLTALENGQPLRLNPEAIDLRPFVQELTERLAGVFDVGRIRVEAPEELPSVSADPDRLERILASLLSNALRYSDPGTQITMGFQRQDGEVVTSVTDQGEGIPPEQLPHLFDPYRREEERPESTGLGLYIAKGLVVAMGGRIWAESQVGKGSSFSFSLPVAVQRDRG